MAVGWWVIHALVWLIGFAAIAFVVMMVVGAVGGVAVTGLTAIPMLINQMRWKNHKQLRKKMYEDGYTAGAVEGISFIWGFLWFVIFCFIIGFIRVEILPLI